MTRKGTFNWTAVQQHKKAPAPDLAPTRLHLDIYTGLGPIGCLSYTFCRLASSASNALPVLSVEGAVWVWDDEFHDNLEACIC